MQKFVLDHIKSFKQSKEIELKPITVFVGKNSSGKSSLIRFPAVLAQTFKENAHTPLLLFGNFIDYGNYDDVIYRHETSSIAFRIIFGPEAIMPRRIRRQAEYFRFFNPEHPFSRVELHVEIDKPGKNCR